MIRLAGQYCIRIYAAESTDKVMAKLKNPGVLSGS
jgi:hypothetical protein